MWQFPTKYWDSRFHWSLRDPETLGLVLEWCLWTGVNSSCPCWLAFALHLTFPTKSRAWICMMMSLLIEEKFLAFFSSTVRKRGCRTSKNDGVRMSVNLLFHRSNKNTSQCGFSFVFGCGVSFLVSSSVFLSMIVQQLVVILVFSQEGVRAHPSTPPSWFLSSIGFYFVTLFQFSWQICTDYIFSYLNCPNISNWKKFHFSLED